MYARCKQSFAKRTLLQLDGFVPTQSIKQTIPMHKHRDYLFGERWSPENEPENRHDKHLQNRLCRFQRHGNLPRPKNVPPARFLNGLSIPVRQKIKAIRMDGFYFLVNDGTRNTNTMP